MCKRNTGDPLVRTFLDRYNVNLLRLPRAGIDCADVFRRDGDGRVSPEFALRTVVTPELGELPIERDEPLGSLQGAISEAREVGFGLKLMGAFFAALGVPALVDDVGAEYRRARTDAMAFEFRDARRDSVDPGELGDELIDHRLKQQPLVAPGYEYFVVTGVVRSATLTVHATAERAAGTQLSIQALQVAGARSGVQVQRESDTTVSYGGTQPLVFGVELFKLSYVREAGDARRFLLDTPKGPLYTHGALPEEPEPAFVGADGDAMIELV